MLTPSRMYHKTQHTAVATHVSYTRNLTYSLVEFSRHNPVFGAWFQRAIASRTLHAGPIPTETSRPKGLLPRSVDAAHTRALWLLNALVEQRVDDHQAASSVLVAWAQRKEYEGPKGMPVLGLKYGIFNYGIWGKPGHHHEAMTILVRKDVLDTRDPLCFAASVATRANGVVEQGLIAANGATGHLEPELGDWLFSSKELAFFRGAQDTLRSIVAEVAHLDAPHTVQQDERGCAVVAITPSVNIRALDTASELEELT